MEQKLFITDFDGTLLSDDKIIHPEDIRMLCSLRENQVVTAIATGRSLYSFEKAVSAMGMASIPVDYIVFSTGAGVFDVRAECVIYQKAIPAQKIQWITDCLDREQLDYMVHAAIPDTRYFFYRTHGRSNPDFESRINLYRAYARPLENGYQYCHPATEVLAILPASTGFEMVDKIRYQLREFSVIQATSPLDHQSIWVEVFHKTVSKSRTCDWLRQRLSIGLNNVISVGNDYNDRDLLDWSAMGFMVENGPEELKGKYRIVPSNNRAGVSAAARMAGLV